MLSVSGFLTFLRVVSGLGFILKVRLGFRIPGSGFLTFSRVVLVWVLL